MVGGTFWDACLVIFMLRCRLHALLAGCSQRLLFASLEKKPMARCNTVQRREPGYAWCMDMYGIKSWLDWASLPGWKHEENTQEESRLREHLQIELDWNGDSACLHASFFVFSMCLSLEFQGGPMVQGVRSISETIETRPAIFTGNPEKRFFMNYSENWQQFCIYLYFFFVHSVRSVCGEALVSHRARWSQGFWLMRFTVASDSIHLVEGSGTKLTVASLMWKLCIVDIAPWKSGSQSCTRMNNKPLTAVYVAMYSTNLNHRFLCFNF